MNLYNLIHMICLIFVWFTYSKFIQITCKTVVFSWDWIEKCKNKTKQKTLYNHHWQWNLNYDQYQFVSPWCYPIYATLKENPVFSNAKCTYHFDTSILTQHDTITFMVEVIMLTLKHSIQIFTITNICVCIFLYLLI